MTLRLSTYGLLAFVLAATMSCGFFKPLKPGSKRDRSGKETEKEPEGGGVFAVAGESALPRRLTPREYANVIQDVLGLDVSDVVLGFPAEVSRGGFRNGLDALRVNATHLSWYSTAAGEIAKRATLPGDAGELLKTFGTRLFRRPLTEGETQAFQSLRTPQLALEALLQSPQFLYRFEQVGETGEDGVIQLNDHAVASRLSFFVWHSAPDQELLDAAADGALGDRAGIRAQLERMLADPRAARGLREFVAEWLQFNLLATITRDPATFPGFSKETVDDLRESALLFFEDLLLTQKEPFTRYLDADHAFVNTRLGPLYGDGVKADGAKLERVELGKDSGRLGYFSQPTFLTLSSALGATDPVRRGLFISQQALCLEVSPPPANVPALPEPVPGQGKRARYETHRSSKSCAGCHRYMDPVGYPLEVFDTIGRKREKDEGGSAIDASGTVYLAGEEVAVDGAADLAKTLAESVQAHECVTRKLAVYGLGHDELPSDDRERLAALALKAGGTYRDIIEAIVTSQAFRRARGDDEE